MRILFIRHAEAVEAEAYAGPDLDRPLTKRGRKTMKVAAAALAQAYEKPAVVYSSAATRARETAAIVAKAFRVRVVQETALLNPGAGVEQFRKLMAHTPEKAEVIAIVGHEPDFSTIVSALVADGSLRLKLKKGACAEVEQIGRKRGILRAVVDPDLLGA